ncbi:MAG: extracellular solute-binding protein [Desulfovibrio sp.]|jgi:iron(III) transport system substrate-binding protein|nr:extracellular solute-binding protein [Desulfovibrio sp.]
MLSRKILILPALLLLLCPGYAQAAEVVLYSSNQPELIDLVSKGFEKKSGVTVTSVRLGTGEAMKRIAAEKANPLADIFWSGDVAVLDAAKDNFTPYDSPEIGKIPGFPADFRDKDKIWTASNTHLMILMANSKLLKPEDMPKSWSDILDPRWKDKVVMADPSKSGSAYAQLYGIYKLYGWDGLAKLVENVRIVDSSSLVYKGTAEGEFPLSITMEYAAYRYVAGGSDAVKIIYPSDGAISAPEGLALVKGGKHPAEAKAFFDYLISRDVVSEIYKKYYRRPARPDADDVPGLPSLSSLAVVTVRADEANLMQKELLGKWREMVLGKK